MTTNFVSEIDAPQTYRVRQKVLRPGKNIQSAHFEGDNLASTHHFGFSSDGEIVGVLSLFKTFNIQFIDISDKENHFQLRGMAVLPEHQKKNIGNQLMDFAENFVRAQKADLIWCNARERAVRFYSARGFELVGDCFQIADIGNHFLMYKKFQ